MGICGRRDNGNGAWIQCQRSVLVLLNQGEIGVGAVYLGREGRLNVLRLGLGEPAHACRKAHECKLVVFTALELKRPAVGPVGYDGAPKVTERQRKPEPRGIRSRQVGDDETEQPFELSH